MSNTFDILNKKDADPFSINMRKSLWDALEALDKKPIKVGRSILTVEQLRFPYPKNIENYIKGSSKNPLCITSYPDPEIGMDYMTPKSIIIHGDYLGFCEIIEVEYNIKSIDALEHQLFAYTESLRKVYDSSLNYEENKIEAEEQLKSYFIVAIQFCLSVSSAKNYDKLPEDETLVRILEDMQNVSPVYLNSISPVINIEEDKELQYHLGVAKDAMEKYALRWSELVKPHYYSRRKDFSEKIVDTIKKSKVNKK